MDRPASARVRLAFPFVAVVAMLLAWACLSPGVAHAEAQRPATTAWHYFTECNYNYTLCENVANAYQGSNYVEQVRVYSNSSAWDEFAVFVDYPSASTLNPRYTGWGYGSVTFHFGYAVDRGKCIWGSRLYTGLTNCWQAP